MIAVIKTVLSSLVLAGVSGSTGSELQLRGEAVAEHESGRRQLESSVDVYHIDHLYPSKEIPYHWFGEAVAMQGDMAIVGAPGTEDFSNYGVAYVYHKKSGGLGWEQVAVLESPSRGVYASFGAAVSIYQGCAFVGAPKCVPTPPLLCSCLISPSLCSPSPPSVFALPASC